MPKAVNKGLLQRDLTVTGVVIAVVATMVAFALGVFGFRVYGHARAEARLRASVPKVYEDICHQRQVLVVAIDAYRQALGCYPPDHVLSQNPLAVDAVTNQLLYELFGAVYSSTNDLFYTRNFPSIRKVDLKTFFNVDGLKNSAKTLEKVRCFLTISELSSTAEISEHPHTVALLSYWPTWEGVDTSIYEQIEAGTWRYNSSAPSHNPGKYDLWIEIKTPMTNIIVGNW